jgi:predicted ATPase
VVPGQDSSNNANGAVRTRYRLLETVRQYALERLGDASATAVTFGDPISARAAGEEGARSPTPSVTHSIRDNAG